MLIARSVLGEVARNVVASLTATTGIAFFLLCIIFLKRTPGVGLGFLVEVFPLFFPLALQFTVPLAVLTGAVLAFSRLGQDGELTALAASGIRKSAVDHWLRDLPTRQQTLRSTLDWSTRAKPGLRARNESTLRQGTVAVSTRPGSAAPRRGSGTVRQTSSAIPRPGRPSRMNAARQPSSAAIQPPTVNPSSTPMWAPV